MTTTNYLDITQQSQLLEFIAQSETAEVLYLDTEFVRIRTYHPQLGLIQLHNGQQSALIDVLELTDLSPLWRLLSNPKQLKVIHSGSEDIEVFKYVAQLPLAPLFDSQIAAAFLNHGLSPGFASLVQHYLGVTLDKGEARTNWLQRPLTTAQKTYAIHDVDYLFPLYSALIERLTPDYYQLVLLESQSMVNKRWQEITPNKLYLQVKNVWQLAENHQALALLQQLAQWRYHTALAEDKPLGFVLRDDALIELAQQQPKTLSQLKNCSSLHPSSIRQYQQALIDLCTKTHSQDTLQPVTRLVDFPNYKQAFKQIKQQIIAVAEVQQIPSEILGTNRQINQYLSFIWKQQAIQTPELISGWRQALLEQALIDCLQIKDE